MNIPKRVSAGSDIVSPPIATLAAVEEQRHAFFCAGREEDSLVVAALGAAHILSPRECGICAHVLVDDGPLLVCVDYLVPAQPTAQVQAAPCTSL